MPEFDCGFDVIIFFLFLYLVAFRFSDILLKRRPYICGRSGFSVGYISMSDFQISKNRYAGKPLMGN